MVDLVFFLFTTLALIVGQTVVLPEFSWFPRCFDLLIVMVLYLSLAYSRAAVVGCIVCIGIVMDSLSGGPFFLHVFSYVWIYLIAQFVKQFVFQRSVVFMMVVSLVSLLVQQGLGLFSVFLDQGYEHLYGLDYGLVIWKLGLGLVFIPLGVWMISTLRHNIRFMVRRTRRNFSAKYGG